MNPILKLRADPRPIHQWRKQIGGQLRYRNQRGPRPFAAIAPVVRGPICDGLVDTRALGAGKYCMTTGMKPARRNDLTRSAAQDMPSVRLLGACKSVAQSYASSISASAWHLPATGHGRSFDSANGELLNLALGMDVLLERHTRYPHFPRRQRPRWPILWAGFSKADGKLLQGSGPEFEADSRRMETSELDLFSRQHHGLTLFPLCYMAHAWSQMLSVFAEVSSIPKRQVLALQSDARNLSGFDGPIQFDLISSRFNAGYPQASDRREK